jgi:hypothetical protein
VDWDDETALMSLWVQEQGRTELRTGHDRYVPYPRWRQALLESARRTLRERDARMTRQEPKQ